MAKSQTHNEIMLRPPPGSRFTIWGSDVVLQFERGKEREVYEWLHHWLDTYVKHEVVSAEQGPPDPNPEITRLKGIIQGMQSGKHAAPPVAEEPKAAGSVWSTTTTESDEG